MRKSGKPHVHGLMMLGKNDTDPEGELTGSDSPRYDHNASLDDLITTSDGLSINTHGIVSGTKSGKGEIEKTAENIRDKGKERVEGGVEFIEDVGSSLGSGLSKLF